MSISETGHAKNVANFENLIARVEALGTGYNPSKAAHKPAALKTQAAAANAAMKAISLALPAYSQAIDNRRTVYRPLGKLASRALTLLKAVISNPEEAETAASLVGKIRGYGGSRPEAEDNPAPAGQSAANGGAEVAVKAKRKRISTSQLSYDMVNEHFRQLIDVLAANPAYAPNEADLKVTGLSALLADLKAKSTAVTTAEIALDTARYNRNKVMYAAGSGLVDTGIAVKNYVKAILSPDNLLYKPIADLEFKIR